MDGKSDDGVVEEAVTGEPVSPVIFPIIREKTGKKCNFRLNFEQNQAAMRQILRFLVKSGAKRTGKNFDVTGKENARTGIDAFDTLVASVSSRKII